MSDETTTQSKGHKNSAEGGDDLLLAQEKKRNEDLMTQLKYLQADFENYRKRTDKQLAEVRESSVRNLVLRLLSVLDELGLAVENARKDGDVELLEGIKMVHKNLSSALEAEGLERIDAVGETFDPRLHEAVEKVRGSSNGDLVVGELRPGYTFRGQVIRPSMVKVELGSVKPKVEGKKSE